MSQNANTTDQAQYINPYPQPVKLFDHKRPITQTQWNTIYNELIAPLSEKERQQDGLSVKAILQAKDYKPDLSGLSLRNLCLDNLDFGGVYMDQVDLSGAKCNFTDFANAHLTKLYIDNNTQLYRSQIDLDSLVHIQQPHMQVKANP